MPESDVIVSSERAWRGTNENARGEHQTSSLSTLDYRPQRASYTLTKKKEVPIQHAYQYLGCASNECVDKSRARMKKR